jgi:outer membrane protein
MMMNRILIGLNVALLAAVCYLFYKVSTLSPSAENTQKAEDEKTPEAKAPVSIEQKGSTPTGKIAFVNIDKLNEESAEIEDLVNESKKRKMSIEASMESLNMEYQKKLEEYQTSAKAGIAPASEMEAKAKYIQSLEKQAQNKQLQMDELSNDMNEKNANFQKTVKSYLLKWNNGRYDYILSYSEALPSMLLGNTTFEVTREIIDGINKEYKESKTKKK